MVLKSPPQHRLFHTSKARASLSGIPPCPLQKSTKIAENSNIIDQKLARDTSPPESLVIEGSNGSTDYKSTSGEQSPGHEEEEEPELHKAYISKHFKPAKDRAAWEAFVHSSGIQARQQQHLSSLSQKPSLPHQYKQSENPRPSEPGYVRHWRTSTKVHGFVERLEEAFGPGDVKRGSGAKPKAKKVYRYGPASIGSGSGSARSSVGPPSSRDESEMEVDSTSSRS